MVMIWIGRLISLPLAVVLFVLLLVTLLLLEVDETFLDPDYYPEELREADIYNFLLVDLLRTGIEDARGLRPQDTPGGLDQNPIVLSGLTTDEIVGSINRMLPPEWVQERVEEAFDQFGHYLTAERDEFEITIETSDRVRIFADEFKSLLRKADTYRILFEEFATPRIIDAVGEELPLGVRVRSGRLVEAARNIAEPRWVRRQIENAIDEFTAYMVGDQDRFRIVIPLDDRVDIALVEFKDILRGADAYDLLYDEVIEPTLLSQIGGGVDLPAGFAVREDEIVAALREVAPPRWVRAQAEQVIDNVGPYLTGDTDRFVIEISLEDNKRQARDSIYRIAHDKLDERLGAIPECGSNLTTSDLLEMQATIEGGGLPGCVPAGIGKERILEAIDEQLEVQVDNLVLGAIPSTVSYSTEKLRQTLVSSGAVGNVKVIDDVRDVLSEGWIYTDADLRSDILQHAGQDGLDAFDELREFLSGLWTYSDKDLLEDVDEFAPEGDADNAREWFDRARDFRLLAFIPTILLAIIIGFLGGRGWWGRLVWGSFFVALSSAIIFGVTGPGYDAFKDSDLATDQIEEVRTNVIESVEEDLYDQGATHGEFNRTVTMIADKVEEISWSIVDRFASGLSESSLAVLIVSGATFGGALILSNIFGRRRRRLYVEVYEDD